MELVLGLLLKEKFLAGVLLGLLAGVVAGVLIGWSIHKTMKPGDSLAHMSGAASPAATALPAGAPAHSTTVLPAGAPAHSTTGLPAGAPARSKLLKADAIVYKSDKGETLHSRRDCPGLNAALNVRRLKASDWADVRTCKHCWPPARPEEQNVHLD